MKTQLPAEDEYMTRRDWAYFIGELVVALALFGSIYLAYLTAVAIWGY